ncbi:hypothetical protein HUG10_16180 [Halorarum halophilum]|uniref:Uncharacterized protein n=1 Tax=Halorarum halophilum TaxID=2743090 RepID=A0A7D5KXY5_9EURY|nr:hypothetical protein [Halobaculum halophilum]QLG28978.1 hypothetical protein HUG10_16180 [Halobaculum halophilum]
MTNDHDAASRRIMDAIGEESRLPIINIPEGDVYVLVGFPTVGLLLGGLTGIDVLVLPLVLLGILTGVAAVVASPSHLPAGTWLGDVARYYLARPRVTVAAPTGHSSDEANAARQTDGGVREYSPFTPDERTQDLTGLERAWPGAGAIEQSDGTMVGMLQLDPANMDFAMSGDWASRQAVAEKFANNDLDFPLTLHATTRPFPVEQLIDQIDDRLMDDDVAANPVFRELLEEYRERRPADLAETQQLHYYLGVEVTPFEVYNRHTDERPPAERLSRIPVLGVLVTPFVTRRERLTEGELRAELFDLLDRRCRAVETELVGATGGWSSHRLDTPELYLLAMEFWNGETHEYGDAAAAVSTVPAIDHHPREAVDE